MILNCNEIIPDRLWVGRCVDPGDVKHLREFGITTLMSLQSDEDLAYYGISMKRAGRGPLAPLKAVVNALLRTTRLGDTLKALAVRPRD
jgi:hypothetical protein